MTSPTQRTLAWLRKAGWQAAIVEKWIAQAKRRIDVFGFGDVLAYDPVNGRIALVQATSGSHHADHRHKILEDCKEHARGWIEAGGEILLITWRKAANGKWTPREEWIEF